MKTITELSQHIIRDMSNQQTARQELQRVYNGLVELGYNPTTAQLIEAATGNFSSLVHQALSDERARHRKFFEMFGTELVGGAEKIKNMGTTAQNKLKQSVRPVSPISEMYLQQFTVNDGTVEVLPEYNEAFFKDKHSIFADPATLKKHEAAVSLLNELFGETDNEFQSFLQWFRFNPDTKQLEISIEAYDNGYKKIDWQIHFNQKVEAIIKQRSLEARIK